MINLPPARRLHSIRHLILDTFALWQVRSEVELIKVRLGVRLGV